MYLNSSFPIPPALTQLQGIGQTAVLSHAREENAFPSAAQASFLHIMQQELQEKEDGGVTVVAKECPSGALTSTLSFPVGKGIFSVGLSGKLHRVQPNQQNFNGKRNTSESLLFK